MDKKLKPYLENIFLTSANPDELFDALNLAIKNNIKDIDLYKILLANPALSKDELMMYGEKIAKELTDYSYDIFMWLAGIFEQQYHDYENIEKSLYYYQKAFFANHESHAPLLSAMKLYNYDYNNDSNNMIMRFISNGVEIVKNKSSVYRSLAGHHAKMGNNELADKLKELAERLEKKSPK